MNWYRRGYSQWGSYVSVGQKLAKAEKKAAAMAKKQGRNPQPVKAEGRKVAKTFWGQAWCDHLDHMSDFENRLARGMTYLRNGSVADLVIQPGKVNAIVAGSEPYDVEISIENLNGRSWGDLKKKCARSIRSLVDLLAGKLDDGVIKELTHPTEGLFPKGKEIRMNCSCPDFADVCKHIAAVFYGIGCLLDSKPELLFILRGVDSKELIGLDALAPAIDQALGAPDVLGEADLGALFGIEMDTSPSDTPMILKVSKSNPQKGRKPKVKTTSKSSTKAKSAKLPVASSKSPAAKSKTTKPVVPAVKRKTTPVVETAASKRKKLNTEHLNQLLKLSMGQKASKSASSTGKAVKKKSSK